jgi:predicted NACHT family NTPase
MIPVKQQTKEIKAAISGQNKFDSQNLSVFFAEVRKDEKKMEKLVRAFCYTYLLDKQQRPLRLRPLQMDIIVKSLTFPDGNPDKQRKLAILAPRGSGKSWALSVAAVIFMFFNRFRDLVFVLAPTEDQCALIFDYCLRHFRDNKFLDSLIGNYKLHNKPHIKMKGEQSCVGHL